MKYAKAYDREAALGAALTLFWTKGFHATSIKDLEAALKMRSGSIYAAFKSKENLYALALKMYFDSSQIGFERDVLNAPSPLEGLVAMIRRVGRKGDVLQRPCMLIKAVITATEDTADSAALAQEYRRKMDQNMGLGFQKARDLGEIPEGADVAALAQSYQADVTNLQIGAQMDLDPVEFAARVQATAQRFAEMRVVRRDPADV